MAITNKLKTNWKKKKKRKEGVGKDYGRREVAKSRLVYGTL